MKLLLRTGEVREQHLISATMGIRLRALTLEAHDFSQLMQMCPESRLAWMDRLSMRFEPVDCGMANVDAFTDCVDKARTCKLSTREGVITDNACSCKGPADCTKLKAKEKDNDSIY